MQMWACTATGASDFADYLADANRVALHHFDFAQMPIQCGEAIGMADSYERSYYRGFAGFDNYSIGCCMYRFSYVARQVDS